MGSIWLGDQIRFVAANHMNLARIVIIMALGKFDIEKSRVLAW